MRSKAVAEALEQAFRQCRDMDASLSERLQCFVSAARRLDETFAQAVDRLIGRLEQTGAGVSAPRPGEQMPPFVLPDDTGRLVSLEQLLADGPVAIAFHRGHWCPYCRLNANALAAAQKAATTDGGQIVAVTPERPQFAARLRGEARAAFPVLTDIDNGYALSLNLAIWVGEEMQRLMADAGRDLPTYQGGEAWTLPIPATFVVGGDRKITARFLDPDYRKRMPIEDLLEALRNARQAS